MTPDRRRFLGTTAASFGVLGLRDLLDVVDDPKPAFWKEALQRMRTTGRPGLVLVAPIGPNDRKVFGQELLELLDVVSGAGEASPEREVFYLCVVTCLTRTQATGLLPGLKGNRALVDPEGGLLASDTVPFQTLSEDFGRLMPRFVRGKNDKHLLDVADRSLARLEPRELQSVTRAFRSLEAIDPSEDVCERARRALEPHAPHIAPATVRARSYTHSARAKAVLVSLLRTDIQTRGKKIVLPFGTRLPRFTEICGFYEELKKGAEAVTIDCGMAHPTPAGRRYVKMLGDA